MADCPYFLINHPEKPYISKIAYVVTILSTIQNLFGFYLILAYSKKETKFFKYAMFARNLSLFLAQSYWALFLNLTTLLPFHAIHATGLISDYFDVHIILLPWMIFIGIFFCCVLFTLLARLHTIARKGSMLNVPDRIYIPLIFFGLVFAFTVVALCLQWAHSTTEEVYEFMNVNFPECLNIFKIPRVMIILNVYAVYVLFMIVAALPLAPLVVYLSISLAILFELNIQTAHSRNGYLHRRKVVIDTITQLMMFYICLSPWPIFQVIFYFGDPDYDSRVLTVIINTLFVSAPIPGIFVLIVQKKSYQTFFRTNACRGGTRIFPNLNYIQ